MRLTTWCAAERVRVHRLLQLFGLAPFCEVSGDFRIGTICLGYVAQLQGYYSLIGRGDHCEWELMPSRDLTAGQWRRCCWSPLGWARLTGQDSARVSCRLRRAPVAPEPCVRQVEALLRSHGEYLYQVIDAVDEVAEEETGKTVPHNSSSTGSFSVQPSQRLSSAAAAE